MAQDEIGKPAPSQANATQLILVALAWSLLVALGVQHHEFWRDEVRSLSSATEPRHLWNLPAANLGESHPLLWYVLLRAAHDIFPVRQVLPGLSILLAALALGLFLVRAPFATWWKALFVLGGLPVYEYVVMARNYGLSMLLMFAFTAQLCSRRPSPVMLGATLFLLAQSTVHAALMVPLLAGVWVWLWRSDARRVPGPDAGRGELVLGLVLAAVGLLCMVLEIFPSKHTLITADLAKVSAWGGGQFGGLALALLEPGYHFRHLTLLPPWLGSLLLAAVIGALACQRIVLGLAALLGLWGMGCFFALIYNGGYRHQGMWFVFLVCLYWLALDHPAVRAGPPVAAWRAALFRWGLCGLMPVLLLMQCVAAWQRIDNDVRHELSKSQALGAAVRADATLHGAIVLAQPDELLEVMPYYLDNPGYKIREGGYGHTPTQSLGIRREVSMDHVLRLIRQFQASTGRPVIFVTSARWKDGLAMQRFDMGWGLGFTVSADELRAFRAAGQRLELGPDAVQENFDAYVFR